ncbi:hypothetical protein CRUP_036299 [Coryphaenoides rupestris]|nr:hypothetical protein CRUP_036299 [Coryphaenoides rupestris]
MEDRGACWTLTGVTVACVAALYLPGVQRTVPGGDSGELITTACELGRKCPEWCQAFPPAPWSSLSAVGARRAAALRKPRYAVSPTPGTAAVLGKRRMRWRRMRRRRRWWVVVEEEEVVLVEVEEDVEVAHPPGYPVFTLLSRLAMYLLPSLSPAHSVNLVCSLLGALASGALCYTVCRWAAVGQATGSALRERKCFPGDWPSARTAVAPEPHPASLFLRGNSMHNTRFADEPLSCPGSGGSTLGAVAVSVSGPSPLGPPCLSPPLAPPFAFGALPRAPSCAFSARLSPASPPPSAWLWMLDVVPQSTYHCHVTLVFGSIVARGPSQREAPGLCGPGPGGLLAGGAFAMSRLTWQWSTVAEVFSLNNLFVGLLLSLTACFHRADHTAQRLKLARWGALCCGLGLCNQHTLVLYVVPIALWVLWRLDTLDELNWPCLRTLALCFVAGFLPYVYLPVSSSHNAARWSWGDQTSLSGFLTHLLRTEYGTFSLAKGDGSVTMATMLGAQLYHWYADFPIVIWPLCGLGLLLSVRDERGADLALLTHACGVQWVKSSAPARPPAPVVGRRGGGGETREDKPGLTTRAPALALRLIKAVRACDQSQNSVVEQFGRQILHSVPPRAIILTRGDLPGNSLRYLHYCQGVRPDVRLVDQEMMTYTWYVAKLKTHHQGVNFPGRWWDPVRSEEKGTFSLEHFLSNNTHRPVVACIGLTDGDPSWERSFTRWPLGVCDHLVPAHTHFHPEEWAQHTRNLYQWSEPHNRTSVAAGAHEPGVSSPFSAKNVLLKMSFPPGSWEHVANEEMWQARMKTAFFLYDLAEGMQGDGKARLYQLSYTLYKEIVEAYSEYPPNWDKNMALVCERLLRSGSQGPEAADDLLTCSVQHFSLYLKKESQEPQAAAIRSAIAHMLQERERLRQKLEQGPLTRVGHL